MTRDAIRAYCLKMPHVEEVFKMHHACYEIGGKTFVWVNTGPEGYPVMLKCTPADFALMVERPGVIPAPYLARAHWVTLEDWDSLPSTELKAALTAAREATLAKLSKKMQAQLAAQPT